MLYKLVKSLHSPDREGRLAWSQGLGGLVTETSDGTHHGHSCGPPRSGPSAGSPNRCFRSWGLLLPRAPQALDERLDKALQLRIAVRGRPFARHEDLLVAAGGYEWASGLVDPISAAHRPGNAEGAISRLGKRPLICTDACREDRISASDSFTPRSRQYDRSRSIRRIYAGSPPHRTVANRPGPGRTICDGYIRGYIDHLERPDHAGACSDSGLPIQAKAGKADPPSLGAPRNASGTSPTEPGCTGEVGLAG
jgi:hypothetical protein